MYRLFMIYKSVYTVYYSICRAIKIYETKNALAYTYLLRCYKPKMSDPKYLSDC